MMAAQATAAGLGPGYEELGREKFKQFTGKGLTGHYGTQGGVG